ncbi:MAG: hypothetical protein MJK04_18295 [Psychrosphaera sp.]|nr:hypothetical protein [Psychrosphaera sp.]
MLRIALGVMLTLSAPAMLLASTASIAADAAGANYQQIVSNPDRPKGDLSRDKSRLTEKLLKFMQI